MTEFWFSVPYRDEDAFIVDVVDAARETQTGDELRVTEQVAWDALARGVTKVGQLVDEIEGADDAGRRQIVDTARESVGLRSLTEIEQRQAMTRAGRDDPPPPPRQAGPPRDPSGKAIQECGAEGCTRISLDDYGNPGPIAARRFWCESHVGQAEAGDLDPWRPPAVHFSAAGAFVSEDEAAANAAHYERLVRHSREQADLRRSQRAAEAEAIAKVRERRDLEARPAFIAGYEVGPDGKIVNGR